MYNQGQLSRPTEPSKILSTLKEKAIKILETQSVEKGLIKQLLQLVSSISTEVNDNHRRREDKYWFDSLPGLNFLTQFTALRLIIDREAELQTNAGIMETIVRALLVDANKYIHIFSVLEWASTIKNENGQCIDRLLTSIVTYAAM